MKLTLTNLHPSLRPPLKKWRKRVLRILSLVQKDRLRYKTFSSESIHVVWMDDARISELNQRFLRHQGPTDIITFDYRNGLAELLISLDTTRQSARQNKNSFDQELTLYMVHGILHLAGFDDKVPTKLRKMRKEEAHLLNQFYRTNKKL